MAKRKEATEAAQGHEWTDREKTTIKALGEAVLAENERYRKEGGEIDERAKNEAEVREAEHRANLKQIRDTAEHAVESEYATAAEAESFALTRKHEQETADAIRIADSAKVGKTGEVKAQIDAQLRQKLRQLEAAYEQESAALEHRHIHEREIAVRDSAMAIADIRSEAAVQDLRNRHQDAEADLLELQHKNHNELAEVDRAAEEKLRRLNASHYAGAEQDAITVQEEAKAHRQAIQERQAADEQAARQRANVARADQGTEAAHTIAELQIDLLKQEALFGDSLAVKEAERLQLVEKYAVRQHDIVRLLRDGRDLTEDQRKKLQAILSLSKRAEQLEILKLQAGLFVQQNPFAPGGEAGRGTIGIKDAARSQADSLQQKMLQTILDQLNLNKQMATVIGTSGRDSIVNLLGNIADNTNPQTNVATAVDQLAGN